MKISLCIIWFDWPIILTLTSAVRQLRIWYLVPSMCSGHLHIRRLAQVNSHTLLVFIGFVTMRSYYIKMKVSVQVSLLVACQQLSLCAPSICYRRPLFPSRSRVRHILICALFDYLWTVEQKHPCHYKSWKMCNITLIWLKSYTPIGCFEGE